MNRWGGNAGANVSVRILVVDDRAENRKALRAVLQRPGYVIVEAASSNEALRELLAHEFAVLLLDVVMPDMDGFELAELVHSREQTQHVPILFITAQAGDVELVARGYNAGAVDYLVKPLVPDIVRAKVAVFVELFRQRVQIEAALREKEVLLREIHHRVKNNLQIISSLLRLQGSHQTADVKALFAETSTRVRSIALVHERIHLAENLAEIDVDGYLGALATGLMQTYGSTRTALVVRAPEIVITMDCAIPCGLIVNELVSNALKYAFPDERSGTITVTLTEAPPGQLTLEVRDDGVGMPSDLDVDHAPRMGLQLVHSLAQQLGGTLELEREGGTAVRIRFPRP